MAVIHEDSIFILGAGASASYGLPLGDDLTFLLKTNWLFYSTYETEAETGTYLKANKIKMSINNGHDELKKLRELLKYTSETIENDPVNFYIEKISNFYQYLMKNNRDDGNYIDIDTLRSFFEDLSKSDAWTIDTFLSTFPKHDPYVEIGKALIAFNINIFEYLHNNKCTNLDDNWLKYFFYRIFSHVKSNDINSENIIAHIPSFLSFNYDEIVKRKMFVYLKSLNLINIGSYQSFVRMIEHKFIHIYGNIKSSNEIPSLKDNQDIYTTSKDIIIARGDSHPNQENINKLLMHKTQIYLLGYGWDITNNKLIFQTDENLRNKLSKGNNNIYTSTYCIDDELASFQKNIGINKRIAKSEDLTCSGMLKKSGLRISYF